MNALLNVLDGLDTKETPIITVLTTNHPENVHASFRRPGRLDTFIHFRRPGPLEIAQLFLRYLGSSLNLKATLEAASSRAAELEMTPAFVKETAEKAVLFTRLRTHKDSVAGLVTDEDVALAVEAMTPHLGLSTNGKGKMIVAPHKVAELAEDIMGDLRQHLLKNGSED